MTRKSKRIIREALKAELKRIAFDANIYDQGLKTAMGKARSDRRKAIHEVMRELDIEQGQLFT